MRAITTAAANPNGNPNQLSFSKEREMPRINIDIYRKQNTNSQQLSFNIQGQGQELQQQQQSSYPIRQQTNNQLGVGYVPSPPQQQQQQRTLFKNLSSMALNSSKTNSNGSIIASYQNASPNSVSSTTNYYGNNYNNNGQTSPLQQRLLPPPPKIQMQQTSSILDRLNGKKVQPPRIVAGSASGNKSIKQSDRENTFINKSSNIILEQDNPPSSRLNLLKNQPQRAQSQDKNEYRKDGGQVRDMQQQSQQQQYQLYDKSTGLTEKYGISSRDMNRDYSKEDNRRQSPQKETNTFLRSTEQFLRQASQEGGEPLDRFQDLIKSNRNGQSQQQGDLVTPIKSQRRNILEGEEARYEEDNNNNNNSIHSRYSQLETELKKEKLTRTQLESKMAVIKEENEKLQRLNRDLALQNSELVNSFTDRDQSCTKNNQDRRNDTEKQNITLSSSDISQDQMNQQENNDNDYMRNLEAECNKLQMLLEHRNMEIQAWMQKYVELQGKQVIKVEETEGFVILQKQYDKSQDTIKIITEQLNVLETQKRTKEIILSEVRESLEAVKAEREQYMTKYLALVKESSQKSQLDDVELAAIKANTDQLTQKNSSLTSELQQQAQYLQEQKGWTDHWKEKAISMEAKIQDIARTEAAKTKQIEETLQGKITQLSMELAQVKNNSAVNAKMMESDKVAFLQQEMQNAQNEAKDMKNQMNINAAELKGILDEKKNLENAVIGFKTEITQLREQYLKKCSETELILNEKQQNLDDLKEKQKQDQLKELSLKQQYEMDNVRAKAKISQLEIDTTNAKIELEKTQSRLKDYQRELDNWSKKCETLEKTHKQQIEELNQHHNTVKMANQDSQIKSVRMELESKVFYLENQVKLLTKEVAVWKDKAVTLDTEHQDSIRANTAVVTELQNKLATTHNKYSTAMSDLQEKSERETKMQISKISELQQQLKCAQQQCELSQSEQITLSETSEKRVREMQEILTTIQSDTKTRAPSQLENKLKHTEKQLKDLQEKRLNEIAEAEKTIQAAEKEKLSLAEDLERLNQQASEQQEQLGEAQGQIEQLQRNSQALTKQLAEVKEEVEYQKGEIESKRAACDFLLAENESLNKKITQLKITLSQMQSQAQQQQQLSFQQQSQQQYSPQQSQQLASSSLRQIQPQRIAFDQ